MTELFKDISDEMKGIAETAWIIAMNKKTPMEAVQFLSDIVEYHKTLMRPQKDIDFLNFYFIMKMEMMKNDDANSER